MLDLMQSGPLASGPGEVSNRFPETSWTLLMKAQQPSADGARARDDFARRYDRPVREFLRALVHDDEKAEELSQEFFTKLVESPRVLEQWDPGRAPFHIYLRQVLRNLAKDYERQRRKRRYETRLDEEGMAGWEGPDFSEFSDADAAFHDAWVRVMLAEALKEVHEICEKRDQQTHWKLFAGRYLCASDKVPSWNELGARYSMDEKTARSRTDTVARHLRIVLRRQLRSEIAVPNGRRVTEADIDEAIKILLSPIGD